MRANIAKVIAAFKQGKSAIGDSRRTCWTDGKTIFSYAMPICWYDQGKAVVVPYEDGPSRTTKMHIHACQYELTMSYIRGEWVPFTFCREI
jgi:hypothetical protein